MSSNLPFRTNPFRGGSRFMKRQIHRVRSTLDLTGTNKGKKRGSIFNVFDHPNKEQRGKEAPKQQEPRQEELRGEELSEEELIEEQPREEELIEEQPREEQLSEEERREQMIRNLTRIYCNIPEGTATVGPRLHSILRLRTEVLTLGDDGDYADAPPYPNFFLPLPREKLREHTVEILNDVDRQDYQDHEEEAYPGPDEDAIDRAQFLSYRIDREFYGFPRKGIEAGTLRGGSMWLGTGDILDDWFWRDMFPAGRKFHFTSGLKVKRGLFPHVTLNIRHDVDAKEDLLRGEVLALIGAMLTRLDMKEWKQHIVIPVMMFSFMSNIQGRILQGYFDGREVVIRKTKLYDFFPKEQMDASTELFLQWMASTPCGDIKNFQFRDFEPLTVQEEEELDSEYSSSTKSKDE